MSKLRRPIRLTVERGAQMYGTVEAVINGMATVRLAANGARLTSLPVVGESVAVSDRVIIDSSADGQPYVRPITQPAEVTAASAATNDEGTTPTDLVEDEALICGKFSRSSSYTDYSPYVSLGASYSYVLFDTIVYNVGGFSIYSTGNGIVVPKKGKYLIQWQVALAPLEMTHGKGGYYYCRVYPVINSTSLVMGHKNERRSSQAVGGNTVLGASVCWPLDIGDVVRLRVISVGGVSTAVTMPFARGKYPSLSLWYITPDGPDPQNSIYWFWD